MKSPNYVEKKSHIFLSSTELFLEKGFVKTTLDNILKRAAVSKGTFYHYFSSKEALLDELAEDLFEQLINRFNEITLSDKISISEKLNQIFSLPVRLALGKEQQDVDIFEFLQIQGNEAIRRRFESGWQRHLNPIFSQLFEQGNSKGCMNVSNLSQTAALVIQLGINMRMHAANDHPEPDECTLQAYKLTSSVLNVHWDCLTMCLPLMFQI